VGCGVEGRAGGERVRVGRGDRGMQESKRGAGWIGCGVGELRGGGFGVGWEGLGVQNVPGGVRGRRGEQCRATAGGLVGGIRLQSGDGVGKRRVGRRGVPRWCIW